MQGTIHPYYTVASAPAIAALVGIAVVELWRGREFRSARAALGLMPAAAGMWTFVLLDRTPDWYPALRWIVAIGSIVIAAILIAGAHALGTMTVVIAAAGLLSVSPAPPPTPWNPRRPRTAGRFRPPGPTVATAWAGSVAARCRNC